MIRVAVDAMGGDRAPEVVCAGAKKALEARADLELILTGTKEAKKLLTPLPERLHFVRASEAVAMDEPPLEAFKKKKDSSLSKGLLCVKQNRADAFFTAGNTGAAVVSSLFLLGRKPGILRPALASFLPLQKGMILIDSGANAECKPEHLLQFAEMGVKLYRLRFSKPEPAVGLINIGAEQIKGGAILKKAHALLLASSLNFVGNVEPDVIFQLAEEGKAPDVLVCDGQTGNLLLKFAEGLTQFLFHLLRQELKSSWKGRILGALLKPSFYKMAKELGYERQPCAPLVGLNGLVTIGHGKSNEEAITNAILQTAHLAEKEEDETK